MNRMVEGYLECAYWTSDDANPKSLLDLAPESLAKATADCNAFALANAADLAGMDDEQAGHDLWLTRNRHGAGFWDRDLGEAGERLTASAHAMGEVDCYVGDDGKVYLS